MISPLNHLKFYEFNFSDYLNSGRRNFVGRRWFFKELERTFKNGLGPPPGVLITGPPGSGKSALMSQLICSRSSSESIHNNIIGYHICKYFDKEKKKGASFVRNLVDQIAGSIPEYSDVVKGSELIQRDLNYTRCSQGPVGCFDRAIIAPLKELNSPPEGLRYIVVDALDECFEEDDKTSEIFEIISQTVSNERFPIWLKLVLTSRNLAAVFIELPETLEKIALNSTDERNFGDIYLYIEKRFSDNTSFADRVLKAVGLTSNHRNKTFLVKELSKLGEGNFLFVKNILEHLRESNGSIDLRSLPRNSYERYRMYFRRQFRKGESNFSLVRPFFEVLLVASTPFHETELKEILKRQNHTHDVSWLVLQVSPFLRFSDDCTISIYHKSFADWLIKQTDSIKGYSVNKSRGHQYIADYYFEHFGQRSANVSFNELFELVMHMVQGWMLQRHKESLKSMNVTNVRKPYTGECILHKLAMRKNTKLILELLLQQFKSVDILDESGRTPAQLATLAGSMGNLQLFIDKGADVNWTNIVNDSLLHTASFHNQTEAVAFLLEKKAGFSKRNYIGLTALQVASENGHLEIVRQLFEAGASGDAIALNRAVVKNHINIVRFLLSVAKVRDACTSWNILSGDHENKLTYELVHFYFGETALYTAVIRGHLDVVKLLLSFGKSTLECKNVFGKTSLMAAVSRNDSEMVRVLVDAGANIEAKCEPRKQSSSQDMFELLKWELEVGTNTVKASKHFLYSYCLCDERAIHIAMRYGLWNMAKDLVFKMSVDIFAPDCDGFLAAHSLALFYNCSIHHYRQALINDERPLRTAKVKALLKYLYPLRPWNAEIFKLLSVNVKCVAQKEDPIFTLKERYSKSYYWYWSFSL